MGCGKTTAGKRLAEKLGYDFIDLDSVIEEVEKCTISKIFETDGQDAFRKIEQRELHNSFKLKNSVISTGGGAPCFFDNMEQINQHGKSVYIKVNPKVLAERLKKAKDERPIIADKTDEELLAFIQGALNDREPFYTKATAIVNGVGLNADRIIKKLA